VLVLTRKPTGVTHPKLREVVINDFLDYAQVDFVGVDACIWALGVSQTAVSPEQYLEITCGYAVAKALWAANPNLRFCFVSNQGASPDARNFGRKIKARAEAELRALNPNVFTFRPAYLRASKHSGPRRDVGRYFSWLATTIDAVKGDALVDVDQLARCLLGVARDGSKTSVFENADVRAYGHLRPA
jgi:hypothetical protein